MKSCKECRFSDELHLDLREKHPRLVECWAPLPPHIAGLHGGWVVHEKAARCCKTGIPREEGEE